jgi:uncharacterized membrane protein
MINNHLGEFIALGTALCWTATGLAFQQATRRVGSLSVNLLRLLMALVLYMGVSFFVRGMILPLDASVHVWIWMTISGLVGFVFGDYFLFKSYEFISARISMLVMALSPPFAAVISYFALGETMTIKSLLAMMVTLFRRRQKTRASIFFSNKRTCICIVGHHRAINRVGIKQIWHGKLQCFWSYSNSGNCRKYRFYFSYHSGKTLVKGKVRYSGFESNEIHDTWGHIRTLYRSLFVASFGKIYIGWHSFHHYGYNSCIDNTSSSLVV